MGIGRRIVRRSVRRAVGRNVWRAAHPVSTARRALTPKPIRKAKRMVYIATNPIGAAQNAMVNQVFRSFDDYNRSKRSSYTRSSSHMTNGTYVSERAADGLESQNLIDSLMKVQRDRFQEISCPVISEPDQVPSKAFYDKEMRRRRKEFKFWQFALKKVISEESWEFARGQSKALFNELLKAREIEQAKADAWWNLLTSGDQVTVTASLKLAFSDNPAPVVVHQAQDKNAILVLFLPAINVLPEKRLNITPTGRLSSKKWTNVEKNQVYGELLGAHLIATLREAWAVAPSLRSIRVVGIDQQCDLGNGTLFDISATREYGRWEDDSWGDIILAIAEIGLKRRGKSGEIIYWDESEHKVDIFE